MLSAQIEARFPACVFANIRPPPYLLIDRLVRLGRRWENDARFAVRPASSWRETQVAPAPLATPCAEIARDFTSRLMKRIAQA
jgi:hypothetical protein